MRRADAWETTTGSQAARYGLKLRGCCVQPRGAKGARCASGLARSLGELLAELLDAAAQRIDALLLTGIERMRFGAGFHLVQGNLTAVVELDGFAGLRGGRDENLRTSGQVEEADFAVLGVDS